MVQENVPRTRENLIWARGLSGVARENEGGRRELGEGDRCWTAMDRQELDTKC